MWQYNQTPNYSTLIYGLVLFASLIALNIGTIIAQQSYINPKFNRLILPHRYLFGNRNFLLADYAFDLWSIVIIFGLFDVQLVSNVGDFSYNIDHCRCVFLQLGNFQRCRLVNVVQLLLSIYFSLSLFTFLFLYPYLSISLFLTSSLSPAFSLSHNNILCKQ